jgi:hypothetical protein
LGTHQIWDICVHESHEGKGARQEMSVIVGCQD